MLAIRLPAELLGRELLGKCLTQLNALSTGVPDKTPVEQEPRCQPDRATPKGTAPVQDIDQR